MPHHPPPDPGEPTVATLRAGEVHALVVHLQLLAGSGGTAALLAELDRAQAEDPTWSDADFWRGLVLLREKAGAPRAEALFRAHVARQPTDERGWHALVSLDTGDANPTSIEALDGVPASQLSAHQGDALSLARTARTGTGLNTAAWYFALIGKPEVGLALARRSLEVNPLCSACLDTLALLIVEDGRVDEGLETQQRAVEMSGEDATKEMVARLEAFRALRDRCRAEPAAPHCGRRR
jgi:hypothetical protein